MPRIRSRFHQCQGKVSHPDRDTARRARADMATQPGREHLIATLVPYRCPHCHNSHLGTADDHKRRLRQFEKRAEKQRRKKLVADLSRGFTGHETPEVS